MGIQDNWTSYQFDSCICTIGLAIEAASQERVNLGNDEKPDWQLKYSLAELLDPEFQIYSDTSDDLVNMFSQYGGVRYDEVR